MSGGSDSATKAAQQQQAQQQADIKQGTDEVQAIFADPSRTGQYQQLADATTNYYTNQLNQQQLQAQNQLTFSLAAKGQTGGSVAADENATLGKDYSQGILQATQLGNQAAASLQAQDTQEEGSLIAAVQGGESAAQAATQAGQAMAANLSGAQANSESSAFGQMFGNISSLYNNQQTAQAAQQGMLYGYGGLFQPGFGYSSGSANQNQGF